MTVKLLTEHHLEFLSLRRICTGSSESSHVKMPHCLKSHVAFHVYISSIIQAFRVKGCVDGCKRQARDRTE